MTNCHPVLAFWWSMIFSENRYPPSGQARGQAFSGSCSRSCSDELDPSQASPAGLTRGSIIFAKGWIAGYKPVNTANGASTSTEHVLFSHLIILNRIEGYVTE